VLDLLDELRHVLERRDEGVRVDASGAAGDGVDSREMVRQTTERRSARAVL
jgi:hypothetical protein